MHELADVVARNCNPATLKEIFSMPKVLIWEAFCYWKKSLLSVEDILGISPETSHCLLFLVISEIEKEWSRFVLTLAK